jgi:hypothetical protein
MKNGGAGGGVNQSYSQRFLSPSLTTLRTVRLQRHLLLWGGGCTVLDDDMSILFPLQRVQSVLQSLSILLTSRIFSNQRECRKALPGAKCRDCGSLHILFLTVKAPFWEEVDVQHGGRSILILLIIIIVFFIVVSTARVPAAIPTTATIAATSTIIRGEVPLPPLGIVVNCDACCIVHEIISSVCKREGVWKWKNKLTVLGVLDGV